MALHFIEKKTDKGLPIETVNMEKDYDDRIYSELRNISLGMFDAFVLSGATECKLNKKIPFVREIAVGDSKNMIFDFKVEWVHVQEARVTLRMNSETAFWHGYDRVVVATGICRIATKDAHAWNPADDEHIKKYFREFVLTIANKTKERNQND